MRAPALHAHNRVRRNKDCRLVRSATLRAALRLPALVSILKQDAFANAIRKGGLLIIAIDEADKCAKAVARLVRSICSETQLEGIRNIRFVLAGVSPFVEEMIREDEGIARFLYKTINLEPLAEDDAAH
jgi:hypothetical protein